MIVDKILSIKNRKRLIITEKTITTYVEPLNSVQLGQATLFISMEMLLKNFENLFNYKMLPYSKCYFLMQE